MWDLVGVEEDEGDREIQNFKGKTREKKPALQGEIFLSYAVGDGPGTGLSFFGRIGKGFRGSVAIAIGDLPWFAFLWSRGRGSDFEFRGVSFFVVVIFLEGFSRIWPGIAKQGLKRGIRCECIGR